MIHLSEKKTEKGLIRFLLQIGDHTFNSRFLYSAEESIRVRKEIEEIIDQLKVKGSRKANK